MPSIIDINDIATNFTTKINHINASDLGSRLGGNSIESKIVEPYTTQGGAEIDAYIDLTIQQFDDDYFVVINVCEVGGGFVVVETAKAMITDAVAIDLIREANDYYNKNVA